MPGPGKGAAGERTRAGTGEQPSRHATGAELARADRASDVARLAAPPTLAGDLQPLLTPREAPPPPILPTPAAAAPNPPMPLPQDFATLVDRLVAAREAAQPLAMHTALAHAEFGRIELRLAADGAGLSVGLASPDPGFAPAVQAAAFQATAPGEDRASRERSDSVSQHASGGAPDDRGSQPQSRGSALDPPPRQQSASSRPSGKRDAPDPTAEQARERRSGIYA